MRPKTCWNPYGNLSNNLIKKNKLILVCGKFPIYTARWSTQLLKFCLGLQFLHSMSRPLSFANMRGQLFKFDFID